MPQPILSVRQPWAWLVTNGHKDVENRTWRIQHRGRLLIHASGRPDASALPSFWAWCDRNRIERPHLTTSAIVGSVEVRDAVQCHDSPWAEEDEGMWHWLLDNGRALDRPVACAGSLMLFQRPAQARLALRRLAQQDHPSVRPF